MPTAINNYYDHEVLAVRTEDFYKSRLDLAPFCITDDTLQGVTGDIIKVRTYTATEGTEILGIGEGNTKEITASYGEKTKEIKLAQNRYSWYDEERRRDAMIPVVNAGKAGVDLWDRQQADIFDAFNEATQFVQIADGNLFNAIIDAQALLPGESNTPGDDTFMFINKKDLASVRKTLKDDLKYVSANAVIKGYIGEVAGTKLYTSNRAKQGTYILATRQAVKVLVGSGVETESERDPNHRKTTVYNRKYYIAYLEDERYAVCIAATKPAHITAAEAERVKYEAVSSPTGNPSTQGYFVLIDGVLTPATDTKVRAGVTYYAVSD